MCGNAKAMWFREEGDTTQYFGPESDSDSWLGKVEVYGDVFQWFYRMGSDKLVVTLSGIVDDDERGREVIEAFEDVVGNLECGLDIEVSELQKV